VKVVIGAVTAAARFGLHCNLASGSGLSSMSLVQKLQAATGKKSLMDILKCAGISIALDGNWCETVMQLSGE
jgi:hypothetical protein